MAQIVSAGAAFAASSLEALAARQACGDPAGTLIDTLPLSRSGAPVQPYGVKSGGRGLDARLVTDLSLLQPGRLITPNDLAFVRTECPAVVARSPRRISRRADERRAAAARSRAAGAAGRAGLVRLRVDQVGERDSPRGRERAGHQPDWQLGLGSTLELGIWSLGLDTLETIGTVH
jgi:hypothetical protein